MSRAKQRRPGTKGGGARRLPDDLPDAAEAALDDMMTQALQPDLIDEDSLLTQALLKEEPADVTRPKVPLPERQATPQRQPPQRQPPPPQRQPPPPERQATPPPRPTPRPPPGTTPPPIPRTHPGTTPPPIPQARDEKTVDAGAPIRDDQAAAVTRAVPGEQALAPATQPRAESEVSTGSALRVVVFEEYAHLGSVQSAIAAAGHQVIAGASGRDGVKRVIDTLRSTSVDVVMVTLPSGEAIVDAALALEPRRPVVIATVDGNPVTAVQRAVSATADLVALRPHDVSTLAPILLAAARLTIERRVTASARGAEEVLRARLDELSDPEPRGLLPFEMFQRVLELEIKRARRFDYALSIALFAVDVVPAAPPPGIRGILRARAGNALIQTVRDIDIATQFDHERFLVLLPYTDLKGASGLARRVIAAVASGDPVVAAGRPYAPKVVGAVAGGSVGQPISFAKLMKDAARALEDARRDGADLAVQP